MRLGAWLAMMAVFPLAILSSASGQSHWAYRPPAPPESGWDRDERVHPVDALLASARREAGLRPARLAEPERWVERAAYTLTGLPPSASQRARIAARGDEATYHEILDELLASPAYGERQARHWMDVARYADTRGYHFDRDNRYPFAYTYRDWLIRAFNEDLPYQDFIRLQIAADHLRDEPGHPDLAALGFLTVGLRGGRVETIDDRVDVVTRGFLSSTVSCARCHDHKTDPILLEDYYSLYSIFENAEEPGELPEIGSAPDENAHREYLAEVGRLNREDLEARERLAAHFREPAELAVYLDLAWQARREGWDHAKATSEAFKRGRYRPHAVLRWREVLAATAWQEDGQPRLREWAEEMDGAAADAEARAALCRELADEWAASGGEGDLHAALARDGSPLAATSDQVRRLMDGTDDLEARQRESAMSRLQAEHPGSPPRAMSVHDRGEWSPARIFQRGNPATPGEPFERHWLEFLGGGPFDEGISPRLSLAERIADPANPLTARVIVNRVWGWQFGEPLADPGDFGPQQAEPPLRPLLDWLALRFIEDGGSLKQLHRLLLTSEAFRLSSRGPAANVALDEGNRFFWRWNRRRLDFESMRDRMLLTAGALDLGSTGGRSVRLEREEADARRTLYAFIDRYELPGTFVSFDLPHPDHHSPQRVETSVPQQALYFLNGPLVLRLASRLAEDPEFRAIADERERVGFLFQRLFGRAPAADEADAVLGWLAATDPRDYEPRLGGYWEIRHAPDTGERLGDLLPFPVFADDQWKTGPDLATAPVPFLHAGRGHGHSAVGHALVFRWRASGAGEVRMLGSLGRTQQGGAALQWHISAADGSETLVRGPLPPEGNAAPETPWVSVAAGDTLDFIVRAPDGSHFGGIRYDLKIEGRDETGAPARDIGRLADQFPTSEGSPSTPSPGDPWADLIQTLWAANEFHFID